MKKRLFGLVILAIALVFGIMVIGCGGSSTDETETEVDVDDSSSSGSKSGGNNSGGNNSGNNNSGSGGINGTWYGPNNSYFIFNNGNYEFYLNANPNIKGTYTTTNDSTTMTPTHIGGSYLVSSYTDTGLNSSTWYTKDEFVNAHVNALFNHYRNSFRDPYRAQIQQQYDTYVKASGTAGANAIFINNYGTTDIDAIADSYFNERYGAALSQYENSIKTSVNSAFTTVTGPLPNANTFWYRGGSFTRE